MNREKLFIAGLFLVATGCASPPQQPEKVHFLEGDPKICDLGPFGEGNKSFVEKCLNNFGRYAAQALLNDKTTSEQHKMFVVYHYEELAMPGIEEFKRQNPNAHNAEELWRAGFVEQVFVMHPDWTREFIIQKFEEFKKRSVAPPGCTIVAPSQYTCT